MLMMNLYLFGKPAWEIDGEGQPVDPKQIRDVATGLHARLIEVAEIMEKLQNAGWQNNLGLYDVAFFHQEVTTKKLALDHLNSLGINPDLFMIEEDEDEDEDEEFEVI